MSWASRRQSLYFLGFIVVLLLLIGVPAFFILYHPPTCSDGIQNGKEEGVDCGGTCSLVCSFQAAPPIIHWSRVFPVIPGVYTTLALVENPNVSYQALNVPYTFKLRDASNVLVAERHGTVTLLPKKQIPIFITGIQTGERVPVRAEFDWNGPIVWATGEQHALPLEVRDRQADNADTQPRVTATLVNTGVVGIQHIAVIAILFDSDENALHASRTVVEHIGAGEQIPLIFTWPEPFAKPVSRIEIIPMIEQ